MPQSFPSLIFVEIEIILMFRFLMLIVTVKKCRFTELCEGIIATLLAKLKRQQTSFPKLQQTCT